ncbi:MAG: hypothetical protein ACI7YS_09480 [Flavobacterium sp.]
MNSIDKKYINFFVALLPLPLFFMQSGALFRGSSLDEDSFALPLNLFLSIVISILVIKNVVILIRKENGPLFMFILVSILCFFYVIIFNNGEASPLLLLISILPFVLSFYLGYCFKIYAIKDSILNKVILKSIWVISVVSFAHILTSFANLGFVGAFVNRGDDTILGLFSIYQKLVYFPTVLALYFVLALFVKSKYSSFILIVLFLDTLIIGSRESLLICSVGFLIKNYKNLSANVMKFFLYTFAITIIVGIVSYVYKDQIGNAFKEATFVTKFNSLQKEGNLDAGRGDAAKLVFSSSEKDFNFLVGTGYSMSKGDQRSPHNQYLEIYLRSGFFGITFFLIMVLNVFFRAKKELYYHKINETSYYNVILGMFLILCLMLIVSFNVNTPVRAPYSSILFGFICGFFANSNYSVKYNLRSYDKKVR